MQRGIIVLALALLGASACATPDTRTALPPASAFAHRVSAGDVRVFWNCSQPEPNLLQVEGVIQNIGGGQVRFAEVEVVAVNAAGRTMGSARSAARDIVLQTNQRSPFQVQIRTAGEPARFDMFYSHFAREEFGGLGSVPRRLQNRVRDICAAMEHSPE
ncbi:MAG: hypothetical protein EHM71_07455 [Zetaproteobacteria bacterium]|nr:MAG: hypothetical protein EHM71_07455 [Zetaproteobacteria bacterium]